MDILIVDDDRNILKTTSGLIEVSGHRPHTAVTLSQGGKILQEEDIDAVFLSRLVGGEESLPFLRRLIEDKPERPVVVFTSESTVESAVAYVRSGAYPYLPKPFQPEQLESLLGKIRKEIGDFRKMRQLQDELRDSRPGIILDSEDEAARYAFGIARKAARSEASILLLGESGNGKSVLARQIHEWSHRRDEPFVTLSCPSLSRELLESELFGHAKGSFTGAVKDHWGKVHAAEGGTLFLDEVGELPMQLQPKLLRLLQEQEYERVGETRLRQADVRVIAATNRDLEEEVAKDNFREDLLYRLNVISITIPSLRSRPVDIARLAEHFLGHFKRMQGRPALNLTPGAMKAIVQHSWPGNLRELSNAIERAVILSGGDSIDAADLSLKPADPAESPVRLGGPSSLAEIEEAHIRKVLARTDSFDEAAKILGIDTATLYRKRKKLGLL